MGRDPYELLGVPRGAGREEIRRAFRRRVKELHPDRHPDDPAAADRLREVLEAYERLEGGGKGKRAGAAAGGAVRAPGSGHTAAERSVPLTERIRAQVEEWLGEGGIGSWGKRRGGNAQGEHRIGLGEAVRGGEHATEVRFDTACPVCGGKGAGCGRCGGKGKVEASRRVRIRVPAGARDGQVVVVRGEGLPGRNGGTAGDLRVRIRVELPERVWVEGDDVHLELPLRLDEAIRGARIVVPTPGGEAVRVSVPPGSDGRSWLRVRGHGLPRRRGTGRGDLLLRPRIVLPETMEGAGETAERVVAAYREDPRAGLSRVFEGPGGGP